MDELRRLIKVNKQEAVKWRRTRRPSEWSGPSSIMKISQTLSAKWWTNGHFEEVKRGFCALDPTKGDGRSGPPVDEDWHAVCQAIYKGIERAEWEKLYNMLVEMHKAVNVRRETGEGRRILRSDQRAADRKPVGHTFAESDAGSGRSLAKSGGIGQR